MFCHHFLSLFVARQKEKENPDGKRKRKTREQNAKASGLRPEPLMLPTCNIPLSFGRGQNFLTTSEFRNSGEGRFTILPHLEILVFTYVQTEFLSAPEKQERGIKHCKSKHTDFLKSFCRLFLQKK